MKRSVAISIVAGMAMAIGLSWATPASADKKEDSVMRKKLEYSQRILEGIVIEDFKLIRKNAEAMQELGRSNAFDAAKTTEYRAQFLMFDFANSELARLADEEKLDGAALAYTQLTLSCVKCHERIRARAK
jgi:hypothetical protein